MRSLGGLKGLSEIEALVSSKLSSEAPLLEEIGRYLLGLGGKRMRPVLTLLVGKAFGLVPPPPALIEVAAGIELIHMATLLHDDIIDKSPLRRHKESAFKKYGVDPTLLTGDFLLTRAFSLCAHLDTFIIDETERACMDLTEGEMLEVPLFKGALTTAQSIEVARKKTASLFRLAAITSAHIAKVDEPVIKAMGVFGENLGVAFQILDDILDITAEENLLGKKSGMDLRERKPSLINVLWIESGSPLAKTLLTEPGAGDDAFAVKAIDELRKSSVIGQAEKLANSYAQRAIDSLTIAKNATKDGSEEAFEELLNLVEYTTHRME